MKNQKILSKMILFATFTGFLFKGHFYKRGLWMRHCVDFVADSYPACELKWPHIYAEDTYTRGECDNLTERQSDFLHFFTIL